MQDGVPAAGLGDLAPLLLQLTLVLAFAVEKVHPRGREVAP